MAKIPKIKPNKLFDLITQISKSEVELYQTITFKDRLIPEVAGKLKQFTLKTKKGFHFKVLDVNPQNSNKYIIYCNGQNTTCRSNLMIYDELLQTEHGIMGFNYPGIAKSEGDFSQQNAQESVHAVYNYLLHKGIKPKNIGIMAHSMGCAVAGEFASKHQMRFVALISPFNKASDEIKVFINNSNLPKFIKYIIKRLPSSLIPLKFNFNNEKTFKRIKSPMYIVACKDDKIIPIELTRKLKNKLPQNDNITYEELDVGGHRVNMEKLSKCIEFIKDFSLV